LYAEDGLKPGMGTWRSNAEAHAHSPFVLFSNLSPWFVLCSNFYWAINRKVLPRVSVSIVFCHTMFSNVSPNMY